MNLRTHQQVAARCGRPLFVEVTVNVLARESIQTPEQSIVGVLVLGVPLSSNDYWVPSESENVTDGVVYPSVDLILEFHEQIVEEGDATEPGVRSTEAIESALQYVAEGYFGEVPQTIHDKAVHLMRLLVADHPFVDGNKRTALRTAVVFYILNGYTFEYGDEIRALLHRFAIDESAVDAEMAVIYFRACARRN